MLIPKKNTPKKLNSTEGSKQKVASLVPCHPLPQIHPLEEIVEAV